MKVSNNFSSFSRAGYRQTKLRLFCFPYAGGEARIFNSWEEVLPPGVEVCPVELPGRGALANENLIEDFSILINTLFNNIQPYLDVEFAFFGHSLGALVCFELSRLLQEKLDLTPAHLFIGGQKAPQLEKISRLDQTWSDATLVEELKRLKGTPREVLGDKNFLSIILPILRADFIITDTYQYMVKAPLNCSISIFGGLEDSETNKVDLRAWQMHTTFPLEVFELPGNHFFIHTSEKLFLRLVSRRLKQVMT